MRQASSTRRCEVRLPVALCRCGNTQAHGLTEFISSRAIRFSLNSPIAVRRGEAVMLFVCLPKQITGGDQVLIRARSSVTGIRRTRKNAGVRFTLTATIQSYDLIAKTLGV